MLLSLGQYNFMWVVIIPWLSCALVELNLHTVFARSDAVATIYFITQFCAASIREQRLLNSVASVKTFVNVRVLRKVDMVPPNNTFV